MLPVDGLVLAGGQSRRMGTPKAALRLDDEHTLLEHARATLRQVCAGQVWISRPFGYQPQDALELPDLTPFPGPIGGVYNGLAHCRYDLLAVLAVDLPRVPPTLFTRLYREWHAEPTLDVVYPVARGGNTQPLAALWHHRALPKLEQALALNTGPRVRDVVMTLSSRVVPIDPEELANINTPEEWAAFRRTVQP